MEWITGLGIAQWRDGELAAREAPQEGSQVCGEISRGGFFSLFISCIFVILAMGVGAHVRSGTRFGESRTSWNCLRCEVDN